MAVCMLILGGGYAQVTTPNNQPFGTDNFVGWDNTVTTEPLMIKHEANQPIDLFTNDIHRFRLLPDATYVVNPNLPAKLADGWALLCPDVAGFLSLGAPGPFSLLHLADGQNAFMSSDREWMNIGITFTGNRDMGYIGQKAYGMDRTDMVFHWSDDPGEAAADRARFLFTSGYNASAPTGATSAEGLEGMRLFVEDDDNINVGIGDWFAANFNDPTITEPEERLDVVDGRVRIRQLPTELAADSLDKFVVVDPDGVLGWRNVPPGTLGCEWDQYGGANNLRTAWPGAAAGCPDEDSHVGIGTSPVLGKLTILETASVPSAGEHGIHLTMEADDDSNYGLTIRLDNKPGHASNLSNGIDVLSNNAAGTTKGTRSRAYMASGLVATGDVMGVEAIGSIYGTVRNVMATRSTVDIQSSGSLTHDAFGVYSTVTNLATDSSSARYLYGVYGQVSGPFDQEQRAIYGRSNTCTDCWAGYFQGKVKITGK